MGIEKDTKRFPSKVISYRLFNLKLIKKLYKHKKTKICFKIK